MKLGEDIYKKEDISSLKNKINNLRLNIINKKIKFRQALFTISFSFGLSEFSTDEKFNKVLDKIDKVMYADKISIKSKLKRID